MLLLPFSWVRVELCARNNKITLERNFGTFCIEGFIKISCTIRI